MMHSGEEKSRHNACNKYMHPLSYSLQGNQIDKQHKADNKSAILYWQVSALFSTVHHYKVDACISAAAY